MNVIEKIIAKQRATKDHFKQTVAHWLSYTCKGHDILRKYARIYAAPWGRVVYQIRQVQSDDQLGSISILRD